MRPEGTLVYTDALLLPADALLLPVLCFCLIYGCSASVYTDALLLPADALLLPAPTLVYTDLKRMHIVARCCGQARSLFCHVHAAAAAGNKLRRSRSRALARAPLLSFLAHLARVCPLSRHHFAYSTRCVSIGTFVLAAASVKVLLY